MADTFTFEEAQADQPQAFSFEEAQGPASGPFSFEEAQASQPIDEAARAGVIAEHAARQRERFQHAGPLQVAREAAGIRVEDTGPFSTVMDALVEPTAAAVGNLIVPPRKQFVLNFGPGPTPPLTMSEEPRIKAGVPLLMLNPDSTIKSGSSAGRLIEGLTTPGQVATLPLTATRIAKPIQILYAGVMGEQLPGQVKRAIATGDRQAVEDAFLSTVIAGHMARGVFSFEEARAPAARTQTVQTSEPPAPISEFGGERVAPPATAATLPEAPGTLQAQLEWLKSGKRAAVLVTPGESAPVPAGMKTHLTEAGGFIYDPAKLTQAQIDDAVAKDQVGHLLGYGIERKPADGTEAGVLTVRDANGLEKQAVVTDQEHLPRVTAAAQAVADPGDTIQLETPADVLIRRATTTGETHALDTGDQPNGLQQQRQEGNPRGQTAETGGGDRLLHETQGDENAPATQGLSAVERKYLGEDLSARRPLNAQLVDRAQAEGGFALPEGYTRQGDQFIFKQPPKAETEAARLAREQREAVEALRQAKAAAPATEPFTFEEASQPPTERVEAGTPMQTFERPHDLLDDIQSHVGGVRIPETEDFAEARAAIKELRQSKAADLSNAALKGLFRGKSAPDDVLNALHHEGLYRNIETPYQLVDEMTRAAKARIDWAEREKSAAKVKPPRRTTEEIDPWQATIDKLNSLKLDTSGQLHAFGLLPETWNTLIDLVKLGVRTGKAISESVDWAIARLKELHPNAKFDEAGAREHLLANAPTAAGERTTGLKIKTSPTISPETKAAVSEYRYEPRSNVTDQQAADDIVQQLGVDRAIEMWRRPPENMPGSVRSKLLGSVTRALADQERQARATQDFAASDALAKRQGELWDEALPLITDMAQSLQALNDLVEMTPEGEIARTRQQLDRVANAELDRRRPEVENVQTALEQGKREGLEAVRNDPAVNGAARAAVNGAIEHSEETKRAVVMELAEPWAQSPELLRQVREQVRLKAVDALNKGQKPAGLNPTQYLRQIMDDLAKRAASIFAGHIQGAEPGVPIVDKLMQRLGLERSRAVSLAEVLSKEWDRQLKAATEALPKRIAQARAARQRAAGELPTAPTSALDAALRRQLRELNLKLGDVLKQEANRQDATGQHAAERIVQASGLTGEKADTLRQILTNRWNTLITDAQRQALERIQKTSGVKVSPKLKSAFDKLVEYDRLGGLTRESFRETLMKSLKLKRLTQEDAAEIRRLVKKAQEQPEGFLRERAAADLLTFTEKLKGNVTSRDVPMAIWYMNVLSGLTTPAKIVFENMNLLVGNTIAELLGNPRNALHPVTFAKDIAKAYGRGVVKGALQAEGTLRSGVVSGVWKGPRYSVLEMKPFGPKFEPLNVWKYFGRVIGTAHELTFKPAWEIKQTMLARDIARREGLGGRQLDQRVADLLADTPAAIEKARGQAIHELSATGAAFKKADVARRTREIIEQQREVNMPDSSDIARDFALRTAYLNEPYGVLGMLATGVRKTLERARKEFPIVGTALKTQVPFTTVAANILNEKMNWGPVGLFRAALSHKTGKLYGRDIMTPNERAQLYTKAIVSTIALGTLADLFGSKIHGSGPPDARRKKQLQASGWIPYSVELNGRYYGYHNTPAALYLATVGQWNDWMRYGKGSEADGADRLAFALKAFPAEMLHQGPLDPPRRLLEALGDENPGSGSQKLEKIAARGATAFVVPNVMQQVDRIFDPTVYDQTGIKALLTGQIPFVRRDNKPTLTVLGDPVESGPFHYWSSKMTEDPLLRTLTQRQLWIPEPDRNQILGKKTDDDYRAMTPDEFYQFVAQSGRAIRERLTDNLDDLATLEQPDAQKLINKITIEERTKAKRDLE